VPNRKQYNWRKPARTLPDVPREAANVTAQRVLNRDHVKALVMQHNAQVTPLEGKDAEAARQMARALKASRKDRKVLAAAARERRAQRSCPACLAADAKEAHRDLVHPRRALLCRCRCLPLPRHRLGARARGPAAAEGT